MARLVILITGMVLGGLIMVQKRVPAARVVNPVTPFQSLVDLRTQLASEQQKIKSEIALAVNERNQLNEQIKSAKVDNKLKNEVDSLNQELGLKPLTSEGVVIALDDSRKGLPSPDKIVQASDIRDVVNVGWLAGGRAVSVNGLRLTSVSSIDGVANTVMVNIQRATNPFVIKVVGDSEKIKRELENHPTLEPLRRRAATQGLLFHIEQSKSVEAESYQGSLKVKVIRRSNGQ